MVSTDAARLTVLEYPYRNHHFLRAKVKDGVAVDDRVNAVSCENS